MRSSINWRVRFRRLVVVAVMGGLLGSTALSHTAPAGASTTNAGMFFGTLETVGAHVAQESRDGVKVAMIELNWSQFEPAEGSWNVQYENQFKQRIAVLTAAGMRVSLGLGLQYTPAWVLAKQGSRFVNQHGSTSDSLNMVFSLTARLLAQKYLTQVNRIVPLSSFWAVRITSGGQGELLYPSGGSYWGFDAQALTGRGLPFGVSQNPFPSWKPGSSGLSPANMRTWVKWYVDSLANEARWQIFVMGSLKFHGFYQIITPGVGVPPRALDRLVSANLPDGTLGVGAQWTEIYAQLSKTHNVVAYVSSLADGSGENGGCGSSDSTVPLTSPSADSWSAARWISRIADTYGMAKSGENPGYSDSVGSNSAFYRDRSNTGMMAVSVHQASSCGFQGLYWAHDVQLWDETGSFSQLATFSRSSAALPAAAR